MSSNHILHKFSWCAMGIWRVSCLKNIMFSVLVLVNHSEIINVCLLRYFSPLLHHCVCVFTFFCTCFSVLRQWYTGSFIYSYITTSLCAHFSLGVLPRKFCPPLQHLWHLFPELCKPSVLSWFLNLYSMIEKETTGGKQG